MKAIINSRARDETVFLLSFPTFEKDISHPNKKIMQSPTFSPVVPNCLGRWTSEHLCLPLIENYPSRSQHYDVVAAQSNTPNISIYLVLPHSVQQKAHETLPSLPFIFSPPNLLRNRSYREICKDGWLLGDTSFHS